MRGTPPHPNRAVFFSTASIFLQLSKCRFAKLRTAIFIARQGYTNLRTFKAQPAPPFGSQHQDRLKIVRRRLDVAAGPLDFLRNTGPP